MAFIWCDYDPGTMRYIEDWLDESAVRSTGLDDGFQAFYGYWAKEDGYIVGENFWCKVVLEHDEPLAAIAFSLHEGKVGIMEIVVAPEKRGQGKGSKLLRELLENSQITGFVIQKSEAVIYPSNTASQKAFETAGFKYHHSSEAGDAMYYVYERDRSE